MSLKRDKQIISLPFPIYIWIVSTLSVLGLLDSVYLSISHFKIYTDIAYESFCAISQSINCDTVSQSPFSIFLGIPIPIWGILGYGFFIFFLPFAHSKSADKKRMLSILFFIAFVFCICSLILAYISIFLIQSYCLMCLASFGINFLLLYYTWLIRKRFCKSNILEDLILDFVFLWERKVKILPYFTPALGFVTVVLITFPNYWSFSPPVLFENIPNGETDDGYPWIGAEHPEFEITEFTDYQCFQCKKMHFFIRNLVNMNPHKIRLIHRQFPMDHTFNPLVKEPFHVGSAYMALFAEYAQTQGKFWKMNDLMFDLAGRTDAINTEELAEKAGVDPMGLAASTQNRLLRYKVKHDIAIGIKLGISGTPAYLIDGHLYLGQIPPEILSQALN
jgi:uncharacterized membrane protein